MQDGHSNRKSFPQRLITDRLPGYATRRRALMQPAAVRWPKVPSIGNGILASLQSLPVLPPEMQAASERTRLHRGSSFRIIRQRFSRLRPEGDKVRDKRLSPVKGDRKKAGLSHCCTRFSGG